MSPAVVYSAGLTKLSELATFCYGSVLVDLVHIFQGYSTDINNQMIASVSAKQPKSKRIHS